MIAIIAIRCPFNDKKITVRNMVRICETAGVVPPALGSICVAKDKPEVEEIFSPARATDENRIDIIIPAQSPIRIS